MFHFASWLAELFYRLRRNARPSMRRRRQRVLEATVLEERLVPNVDFNLIAKKMEHPFSSGGGYTGSGYTPAQIRDAYGVGLIAFGSSLGTISGDGSGQTIAIVTAYDDPKIASDLQVFDQTFHIAAPPSFEKRNEYGSTTGLPKGDEDAASETSLDVEWVHAMAPGASIVLVEANDAGTGLNVAMQTAENLQQVSVISLSWGYDYEAADEVSQDDVFLSPSGHGGVTVLNASGDGGSSALGTPDTSPNVVTVGGTTLNLKANNAYSSETAWSDSTGGTSKIEAEPEYQEGVQSSGFRSAPDVAFDADPNTGVAVYDSYAPAGQAGWSAIGGTSMSAPCWAGLIAIADQGRALDGETSLDGTTQTLPALYSLPARDFHDITKGSNGAYKAAAGYDEVTGLGTPVANDLVADLASMHFMQDGEVGQAYDQTLSEASGTTVSYSLTNPNSRVTPSGLGLEFSVQGSLLTISGTPQKTGSFGFIVTATSSSGTTTQLETLTVDPDLTLNPTPLELPGGTVGNAYSQTIATEGGSGTEKLTYKLTSTTTPSKLGLTFTIVGASLEISGSPKNSGVLTFTATATDAYGSVSQGYTVSIGLNLSTLSIPAGAIGTAYDASIAASGGSGTTTVSDIVTTSTTAAELGLTLAVNGTAVDISGTPTAAGTVGFNVLAQDSRGDTTVDYYTLMVGSPAAPIVTLDPTNATVDAGGTASFSAEADGGFPSASGVQWQISTDGGTTFANLSPGGAYGNSTTSDRLTISDVSTAMNGYEYLAVFTNGGDLTASSSPALLTVDYAPIVSENPENATADAGGDASFAATAADGNPTPTNVQWQISTDGGKAFSDLASGGVYGSSPTTTTLTVTGATASLNGDLYRAVFSNAAFSPTSPDAAITTAASLTVDSAPTIVREPTSLTVDASKTLFPKASFTASTTGGYPTPITVHWQLSTDGGNTFNDIPSGGIYGNSPTTSTLTISSVTPNLSGDEYRAISSNAAGFSVETSAATLTLDQPPSVTTQPVAQTIDVGESATFEAAASGNPVPAVRWQISSNRGLSYSYLVAGGIYGTSVDTSTLTISSATAAMNGDLYRAVFSNRLAGEAAASLGVTAAAKLTVDAPVVIEGTRANQKLANAATIHPFAKVILLERGNGAELQTIQVALSNPLDGTLTGLGAGNYDTATGLYTLADATLAQAQAAIRALVFVPTPGQASPSQPVTTKFTLWATDVGGTTTDDNTSTIVS